MYANVGELERAVTPLPLWLSRFESYCTHHIKPATAGRYALKFSRQITVTDSAQIALILYAPQDRQMVVHFKNGAAYRYRDVPDDTVGRLVTADSVGKEFSRIKDSLKSYERIT